MGVTELAIIAVVIVVLFGATRLPKLARQVGEAAGEVRRLRKDDEAEPT